MYDTDSPSYAEYAVEKKAVGQLRYKRIALILIYVAIACAYFAVCVTTFVALIAVLPMLLLIFIYFTWPYVSYDVSWRFEAGKMTFFRVYGARSRRIFRRVLEVETKNALYVGVPDSERGRTALASAHRVYDFTSAPSASDEAILVFEDKDGKALAVRFHCIGRLRRLLRSFAPGAELDSLSPRF